MKAVRDLPGLWRALARSLRIETSTVAADHLHFRMIRQPAGRGFRRSVRQQVRHLTTLQVHDDRAVVATLPPRPVINTSHTDRAVNGPKFGMPVQVIQVAQDRRVADRHAEPPHQALRRPPAHAMTNESDDFRQAGCLASEWRRKSRKALGKNAPIAPFVSAPPARYTRVNDNRRSLRGQIPKPSRVNAVTRFGLRTASWTACRLPAVHGNFPSLFSPLDAHDVQVRRG